MGLLQLSQELKGHRGHINSMCVGSSGEMMYSGDSVGEVMVWSRDQPGECVCLCVCWVIREKEGKERDKHNKNRWLGFVSFTTHNSLPLCLPAAIFCIINGS